MAKSSLEDINASIVAAIGFTSKLSAVADSFDNAMMPKGIRMVSDMQQSIAE